MAKRKSKLELLQAQFKNVKLIYNQLQNEIDDLEFKAQLPNLKKQYEGKFWKCENRYSTDEVWWLYSFCKEVKTEKAAIMDSFQTTPHQNEFHVNDENYFHMCEIEITKEEYMTALTEFLSKCMLMRDNVNNYE